jgi:ABC-type multidrug transport system fused ATPase/permease subunit
MKNQKDEIQKYNVIQNVGFTLANVWRWDKSFYIGFIPKILLSVFLPLATIYFPMLMIEMITGQSPQNELLFIVGIFCMMFVLFELISILSDAKIGSMRDIFRSRYEEICELKHKTTDYQNTENPKINELYNNAMNNTGQAEGMIEALNRFFVNILGMVGFGSIIIILNPIILVIIFICTAVNFLLLRIPRIYNSKNWRKWASIERRYNYFQELTHSYEKIKDIKTYPYPKLIYTLLEKCHNSLLFWRNKAWNRESLPTIGDVVLALLRNGIVYYILLSQVLNGSIDVGLFVFYFGAVTGFSGWLNSLSGQFSELLRMSTQINFIRSFLEIDDLFYRGYSKKRHESKTCAIELRQVKFSYPSSDNNAIENMNIKINKGEKIALVGANGAGKTTLIKLICGLYYPTEGDVCINGVSVKDTNINEYYDYFSIVFQDFHIVPISIAQYISGNGVDIDRKKVQKCLEQADLWGRVQKCNKGMDSSFYRDIEEDDPGIDFSGGERQRFLLARALYKDAPILILDEPTAALDPIAESELYEKYDALTKGKTSIYISHRLASTRFCDRILLMENGKIIESGSHKQLIEQKGRYYEMFEVQSHYYKEDVQ